MAYEKRHEPLVSRRVFAQRMVKSGAVGLLLMVVALAIGTIGYRFAGDLSWIDAEYNAAMILTGMGPVTPMGSTGGKIWASAYALFSGVVFLGSVGVFFAPLVHRLMHRFHLESGH